MQVLQCKGVYYTRYSIGDACQKIEKSVLDELVTDTIKYVCPSKITKVRVVSVGELFGEAIRRVTNEELY